MKWLQILNSASETRLLRVPFCHMMQLTEEITSHPPTRAQRERKEEQHYVLNTILRDMNSHQYPAEAQPADL